jgi:hypothetical protein
MAIVKHSSNYMCALLKAVRYTIMYYAMINAGANMENLLILAFPKRLLLTM